MLFLNAACVRKMQLGRTECLCQQLLCGGDNGQCRFIVGPERGAEDAGQIQVIGGRASCRCIMSAPELPVSYIGMNKRDLTFWMTERQKVVVSSSVPSSNSAGCNTFGEQCGLPERIINPRLFGKMLLYLTMLI